MATLPATLIMVPNLKMVNEQQIWKDLQIATTCVNHPLSLIQ
jgi:hypothetical protein